MVQVHPGGPMITTCTVCSRVYDYTIKSKSGHGKTKCNSCIVNFRRFAVKAKSLEYKGGKCIICGYNKCSDALVFHHMDPNEKEFDISGGHARSWISLKKELDKCVLLCVRCHVEVHAHCRKIEDNV